MRARKCGLVRFRDGRTQSQHTARYSFARFELCTPMTSRTPSAFRAVRAIRFDRVPAVGAALTIFGIVGFAPGRTHTWQYWAE